MNITSLESFLAQWFSLPCHEQYDLYNNYYDGKQPFSYDVYRCLPIVKNIYNNIKTY